MTEESILKQLRKMTERSLREGARQLEVSPAYLSDVLKRKREPGRKILKALGLKKIVERRVRYEKEGKVA